jgi:D-alanine-D-alanine ligase
VSEKTRLLLLFGGRSSEHEISLLSAKSMLPAIHPDRYELTLVGITREGSWRLIERMDELDQLSEITDSSGLPVLLDYAGSRGLVVDQRVLPVDVVFPLLHGTQGEDGAIQGLLELSVIPYVGSDVFGSAICMDKVVTKKIFAYHNIPQVEFAELTAFEWEASPEAAVEAILGRLPPPLFIKPARQGSSVGVGRATDRTTFMASVESALRYDDKVVIEAAAGDCHEVECGVLGNDELEASIVGEIIPNADFYDYQAKYLSDSAELLIPAKLPYGVTEEIRQYALSAFRAVGGKGMGRVDFFVERKSNNIKINEINTIPGFTQISMFPKLWEASGLDYSSLIDRLISLALERQQRSVLYALSP